jgi:NAD(P)-dependent dehydrogenase (short-subunit alcohol dehydrogenase family)
MPFNLFDVKDKVIVVTGGMGQLGIQFVQTLHSAGARVAVLDVAIDEKQVSEKYKHLANDPALMFEYCDITSKESIKDTLIKIIDNWDVPHGLINNAALDSPPNSKSDENGPFETYPEESWDKVMDVNAKGVFLICQEIGGAMAEAGRGSIINVSSIYGIVSPNQSLYEYRRQSGDDFFKPVAYSASKSALLNLTRYLSTYWGSKNVRVNAMILGGVFNNQDKKFLDGYESLVPLGRMANENEYNGAAIFLLSDASSYMTGSNLVLDGGWTAW